MEVNCLQCPLSIRKFIDIQCNSYDDTLNKKDEAIVMTPSLDINLSFSESHYKSCHRYTVMHDHSQLNKNGYKRHQFEVCIHL